MKNQWLLYPEKQSEKSEFLHNLPKRNDFIDKKRNERITKSIQENKPILFHGHTINEQHHFIDFHQEYVLVLIGVLEDGSKTALAVKNIDIFIDLKIPENTDPDVFNSEIQTQLMQKGIKYDYAEVIYQKPFMGFTIENQPYIRFHFKSIFQRQKLYNAFNWNSTSMFNTPEEFNFVDKSGATCYLNNENKPYLTNDDKTMCGRNYFRKVAREYKINLCGWNKIQNYKTVNSSEYVKKNMVSYVFEIDIKDISPYEVDPSKDAKRAQELMNDLSMDSSWDIETYSWNNDNSVPMPEKITDKNGKLSDVIFMISVYFGWYWSNETLITVCITDLPTKPRDDCLVIFCQNQEEIIKTWCLLMEKMTPDFYNGFNDGYYDTPFLIERLKYYNLMEFAINRTSVVKYKPQENQLYREKKISQEKYGVLKGIIGENTRVQMKLESDQYYRPIIWDVPGMVHFDVRGLFKQIYSGSNKSSLNYFLGLLGMESKEDMEYKTMFTIYRISCKLRKILGLNVSVDSWYTMYEFVKSGSEYPIPDENLKKERVLELLELAEQVMNYCNVDAKRCHELILRRKIISDNRVMGKMSYVCFFDTIYYAGGMKVRNLSISYAVRPEWQIAISNINYIYAKDPRKYTGAYVVSPKKGGYRDDILTKTIRARHEKITKKISQDNYPLEYQEVLTKPQKDLERKYVNSRDPDIQIKSDRPCVGLDFSSLYPSIMMAYNGSPEKTVNDEAYANYLRKLGYELVPVNFVYGVLGQGGTNISGYFVQHNHPMRKVLQDEFERALEKAKEKGTEWDWVRELNPEIVKKCQDAFNNTSLEEWREYGFGLYPYIMRDLFARRKAIKKDMEKYKNVLEMLDSLFNSDEIEKLSENSQQYEIIKNSIGKEILSRKEIWENTEKNKDFYKFKYLNTKKTGEFILQELREQNISELYKNAELKETYYDTKQKFLKVFMNTYYGEVGNSLSPFFMVTVAGGITTYGQKNTRAVKKYCEQRGFQVLYGDTDSVYCCAPEEKFKTVDEQYLKGSISKLEYWSAMVEITMETLNNFKDEVNNMLMFDNFSPFLNMAYEEVLWPFALLGKKKYIGIQHEGVVNFRPCMTECKFPEFYKMVGKAVFVRGLELIKRGSSEFLRTICAEIFHEFFNIEETRTLIEIVHDKLNEISERKFDPRIFAKSAKYNLPKGDKPGNVSVLRFLERMKKFRELYPNISLETVEVGDRFEYIIVRKYPWRYDIKGRQKKIDTNEKYEFLSSLNVKEYQDVVGELEIDNDYYIKQEIIGQFARFVIYNHVYDKFSKEEMTDEEFKEADKQAHTYAAKQLRKLYDSKYATKYENNGKYYKAVWKNVFNKVQDTIVNKYGSNTNSILKLIIDIYANGIYNKRDIAEMLYKYAIKQAQGKIACPSFNIYLKNSQTSKLVSKYGQQKFRSYIQTTYKKNRGIYYKKLQVEKKQELIKLIQDNYQELQNYYKEISDLVKLNNTKINIVINTELSSNVMQEIYKTWKTILVLEKSNLELKQLIENSKSFHYTKKNESQNLNQEFTTWFKNLQGV